MISEHAFFVQLLRAIEDLKETNWWTPWVPVIAAMITAYVAAAGVLITLYTNKWLTERNFDRQALESQFTDILNRFASENPIIRANAAIRLGDGSRELARETEEKNAGQLPFLPGRELSARC